MFTLRPVLSRKSRIRAAPQSDQAALSETDGKTDNVNTIGKLILAALGFVGWTWIPLGAAEQIIEPKSDPYFRPASQESTPQPAKPVSFETPRESSENIVPATPPSPTARAFEPGQVIALVGGEPIFFADMTFEANQILENFMPQAPPEVRQREMGNVIRALTPKYVEQKLLHVYAKQQLPEGASWPKIVEQAEKDFDERMLPKLLERSRLKSQLDLDAQFRAQGTSLRAYKRRWAEDQVARYFNMQKLNLEPEITHQEMLDYYQQHRHEFTSKARVRWEELAVMFDRFPNREAAYESIVQMGNEVVYGASFAAVAARSSQGITASAGGQHDWTTIGSLVHPAIEEALFTIPVAQLSDLIETKIGVHIVRVLEREDTRTTPFVEAQTSIKEKLLEMKREEEINRHTSKLRDLFPIEIIFR